MKVHNPVKEKLLRGEPCLGTFCTSGDPLCAEVLACAGCEWVLLDLEHFPIDMAAAANCFRGIEARGAVPLARIPAADPVWIKRALDAGALGILVPLVRSAEEVRQVVEASRFPPVGKRPYGGGRAGTIYSKLYIEDAAREILVMVQIETVEAVDDLDAILAVEGVDGFFVGPTDLSLSNGVSLDASGNVKRQEMIRMLGKRIVEAGRIAGVPAASPEQVAERVAMGYRMIPLRSDLLLLHRGMSEIISASREALR